jgi:hypothetical protein
MIKHMFMKFEVLTGTVTLSGTVSGKRGDWTVRITSPGGVTTEDQTTERTWFPLWTELVSAASDNEKRKRVPSARPEAMR